MGGYNVNIPLVFEDGVRWLARVKLQEGLETRERSGQIMASEIVTLQVLQTLVKVPAVFVPDNSTSAGMSVIY
jgi:hypothetical protein